MACNDGCVGAATVWLCCLSVLLRVPRDAGMTAAAAAASCAAAAASCAAAAAAASG